MTNMQDYVETIEVKNEVSETVKHTLKAYGIEVTDIDNFIEDVTNNFLDNVPKYACHLETSLVDDDAYTKDSVSKILGQVIIVATTTFKLLSKQMETDNE